MSFPLYEKIAVTAGADARNPALQKLPVNPCSAVAPDVQDLIYQKGRRPKDGDFVYRWIYLKNGEYAGATCWYADNADAVEECHVAMRRKGQDKTFDSIASQTCIFREKQA